MFNFYGMLMRTNPNSKYSQHKRLREFQYDKENNWSEEKKRENDFNSGCLLLFIFGVVCGLVLIFSGTEGLIEYLSK
jgi:hypothetical protein